MGQWPTDLLTRITEIVDLAGAIFIAGDDAGFIWYHHSEIDPPAFVKVSQIGENQEGYPDVGECTSSSYAIAGQTAQSRRPTFVIGGYDHGHHETLTTHPFYRDGVIFVSHNGRTWEQVWTSGYNPDQLVNGAIRAPQEMVWDSSTSKFYAWVFHREPDTPGVDGEEFSECWSSSDGYNWSLIDTSPAGLNPEFESHCRFTQTAGRFVGKGLPDGKYGFDPAIGLLITVDTHQPLLTAVITFAGGVWARGGSLPNNEAGFLEVSKDNAVTWSVVGRVDQVYEVLQTGITTLCGQPSSDVATT